jgi:hypothetical protein
LSGTTSATSNQTNNNSATNYTDVTNRNTVINQIRGSSVQVGDIYYETPSIYFNAATNIHGDAEFQGGVIIPLGGGKVRKSAKLISLAKADAAKGAVCKSIKDAGFNHDTVVALYPNNPEYRYCVYGGAAEARVIHTKIPESQDRSSYDQELEELRREIAVLKAREAAHKMRMEEPVQVPVKGLW